MWSYWSDRIFYAFSGYLNPKYEVWKLLVGSHHRLVATLVPDKKLGRFVQQQDFLKTQTDFDPGAAVPIRTDDSSLIKLSNKLTWIIVNHSRPKEKVHFENGFMIVRMAANVWTIFDVCQSRKWHFWNGWLAKLECLPISAYYAIFAWDEDHS